jgi:hypothetical protein
MTMLLVNIKPMKKCLINNSMASSEKNFGYPTTATKKTATVSVAAVL